MKTWRQLEAMAKRQGVRLSHGSHTWWLQNPAGDDVARGQWWMCRPRLASPILRAMCEAALKQMGRKR